MGRSIVCHVDEAPWVLGGPREQGQARPRGTQLAIEEPEGPRVTITSWPPHHVVDPHSHSVYEVLHIIEGEIVLVDRQCGPGTLIYMDKDTEYSFATGPDGVRFVGYRPKRPETRHGGTPSE